MKKFLSIDYDYFQKVSKDILKECYPDGIDLPTSTSNIVWGSRYASFDEKLRQAEVNWEEIEEIQAVFLNQPKDIPVMVAQSHVNAYDFVLSHSKQNEKIVLVNVDMHHDYFNDNEQLDCGNWIRKLHELKGEKLKWRWIANPVGLDSYGFNREEIKGVISETVGSISEKQFDGIFLCRSDQWSPPHLDAGFMELLCTLTEHFDNVLAQRDVLTPRAEKVFGIADKLKAIENRQLHRRKSDDYGKE